MKLSILTTITNPEERQDPWKEAIACYKDLADEVVVVDGGAHSIPDPVVISEDGYKRVISFWPSEWSFEELPKHLNKGLQQCTGDWVIKLDIDQFIHEKDFTEVRKRLEALYSPVATFQKMSVYPRKRYIQKGEMIVAINRKDFPNICFGDTDNGEKTDLCKPIFPTSKNVKGIPIGDLTTNAEAGRTGVSIWNFDYTFKTEEVSKMEFARFARAYKRYFGEGTWGNSNLESWNVFLKMMTARYNECNYRIEDSSVLPKYIRERYDNLRYDQFGFNGWGKLTKDAST